MDSLPLPDSNAWDEFRCSHCGAAIALPAGSSESSCSQCGQPVSGNGQGTAGANGTVFDEVEMTIDFRRESPTPTDVDPDATLARPPDQTKRRSSANPATKRVQYIGRFEIRQRLGQGAFGVVYRAYDPVLDRDVALKVPRLVTHDKREIEYFFQEAKAAARLRHPNIVAVFESGKVENFYYIAAEFVEGEPLSELLEGACPPIREVVQWMQELAGAVGYAHGEGIVHRDIKPANIMIGKGGRPQLMDFGLAKSQRNRDDGTTDGNVIGTPSYMSPEQARGEVQHTGPLSDQYSLGAVLYQVLTGQRPYFGATVSVVSLVASEQHTPPAPTTINPAIPKDLEACCLKAMNKVPAQRYASSENFAADLRRWLRGEPVHARPISSAERLWRWCHRNPTIASLTTAIALLLIVGSIIATSAAFGFRDLAERERNAADRALIAAERERIAADKAEMALSDSYTNSGLVASDSGQPAQAVLWFVNAAAQARHDQDREIANRIRVRNWSRELPLPIAMLPDVGRLKHMAFHPGGRYLLTLSLAGKCAIWDLEESRPFPLPADFQDSNAAVWSADGKWLAVGKSDRVVLSSFPDGELWQTIAHAGAIFSLEFSRDGEHLAIGGDSVRVWDLPQERFASPLLEHPKPVSKLLFNARGDRLVTAAQDEMVRVFPIGGEQKSEPLFEPLPNLDRFGAPHDPVSPPLLIDDDRGLLTKTSENEIVWWNAETGVKVRLVPTKQRVLNLARSADGQRFIVCDFKQAQLWDVAAGEAIDEPLLHTNFVYSAAFSFDGKTVVTAGADRKVGLWEATTGEPKGPMLAHQNEVDLVVLAPDGNHFAAAQIDGLVRVWQLPSSDSAPVRHVPIDARESFLTLSSDGRSMAPSGWNLERKMTSVRFYDVATGTADQHPIHLAGVLNHVAASPDGTRFVTLSSLPENNQKPIEAALLTKEPGLIEFWSRNTDRPLFPPISTPTEPVGAAWSADDKTVAVICGGGQILVIDAESGQTRHQCDQEATMIPRYMVRDWIRFAPDGQIFATWGMGSRVRVWEAKTGARMYELQHGERCHDVKFSPRGDLIATMSMDATVGIWNVTTGEALQKLQHPDWVFTGEFSRDGRKLLTACRDRMARLWDWEQGKLICPAMEHADEVFGVAFADGERVILTGSRDRKVQLWDSHIGKLVARPLIQPGMVYQISVTPDEKHAVAAGYLKSLAVIGLQDVSEPVAEQIDVDGLRMFGEIVSGQRVHEGGGVVNLTTQEWLERWNSFHAAHPHYEQFFR